MINLSLIIKREFDNKKGRGNMKSLFYGFMNITNKLAAASAKIDENYNSSVSPLYEFLDAWGPFLIGMVTGLCVIFL